MRTSLVIVAVAAIVYAVATPIAALGEWQPIRDITAPHVQVLGSWAVAEHLKKDNDGLKFSKVLSGEEQVGTGITYQLEIDALDLQGKDVRCDAVVYEEVWINKLELVSFSCEF